MHKQLLSGAALRRWEMSRGNSPVQPWSWCPTHSPPGGGAPRGATGDDVPHLFMWGTKCLRIQPPYTNCSL